MFPSSERARSFGACSISRNQMPCTAAGRAATSSTHARARMRPRASLSSSLLLASLSVKQKEAPCNGGVHAESFIGTADMLAPPAAPRSFIPLGRAIERATAYMPGRRKEEEESETGGFLFHSPSPPLSSLLGIRKEGRLSRVRVALLGWRAAKLSLSVGALAGGRGRTLGESSLPLRHRPPFAFVPPLAPESVCLYPWRTCQQQPRRRAGRGEGR